VTLADQDRSRWDQTEIREGLSLMRVALRARPPTRYALMAAIAAVHAQAPAWHATDWRRVAELYDTLAELWPSPVVALNRAIAHGHAYGPQPGLELLDALGAEPQLATYHYLPAARATFLHQLNRIDEARLAYTEALTLTENAIEREYLRTRLAELDQPR
jgi:predicted RNA polymerase sigma factor